MPGSWQLTEGLLLLVTGRTALSTTYLDLEYQSVMAQQSDRLTHEIDATYSLDGWSNCQMQSLYSSLVLLADRSMMVWDVTDLSSVAHTGAEIASVRCCTLHCQCCICACSAANLGAAVQATS